MKPLLSQELLTFAETENTKFLTEYQHFNSNMVQTINDEYLMRMNAVSFEAAKFQNEVKTKPFPSIPTLPNFNSFLLLESHKYSDISRWNTLKAILREKKVPYKVLEGDVQNYYYKELKDLLVNGQSVYTLKSLEINEKQRANLDMKKQEYAVLTQCMVILQAVLDMTMEKKWKEAMLTLALLHEKLNLVKVVQYKF